MTNKCLHSIVLNNYFLNYCHFKFNLKTVGLMYLCTWMTCFLELYYNCVLKIYTVYLVSKCEVSKCLFKYCILWFDYFNT